MTVITILPADEMFYAEKGITDPAVRAMVIAGGETVEEYILFTMGDKEMELTEMHAEDFVLQEGLVRAALNYGFRRELETAFSVQPAMDDILRFLVFKDTDGRKEVSLGEFFSRGCKHCVKN